LWSYWQCWNYISLARTLASAKAHDFLQRDDDGVSTAGATEDNHGFLWFAESAKGTDRNPQLLAHLQLVLAFAGVHTVLNRMVNVLYDLIANPSYISELRNEISSIHQAGWDASAYDKLLKMDSVIRESQRMNPASSLNVRRVFKKPHTFANGVHIPQGTYACLPVYAIENDPAYVEDPDTFSGLRSYHQRQKNGEEQQHQFTSIDKTNFGFGYGKSACPGRFFASLMIKAVFVKLLTEYEIAFLPGKGRPKCLKLHEFIFPWPWERVLIKKRQKSSCPF
jgi:cytochrome P450